MKKNKFYISAALACILSLTSFAFAAVDKKGAKIYEVKKIEVIHYAGTITAASAEYFNSAFERNKTDKGADLLVISLDTPGGLDTAMREIIKGMMGLNKPVAVFVSPQGARAASAGVFITMAASVAAMAPGTNIGAAHPVFLGGIPIGDDKRKDKKLSDDGTMSTKVLNDSVAYIHSIAQKTGRNVNWAMDAVKKSVSIPSEEAVKLGVVDFIAQDTEDFLKKLDGRKVGDFGIIKLQSPVVQHTRQNTRQSFLSAISTPDIAMFLAGIGAAGIFIEMYNPGLILPGVVGAISLVLSFYSFQNLSANAAGIVLMFLAFVFFIAEIKVMSYGLLTVAGALSMLIGGLLMFDTQASGGMNVSMQMLLSTIVCLIAVVAVLAYIVYKAQMNTIVAGIESLAGKNGICKTDLTPKGKVLCEGELWEAESIDGNIKIGESVTVTEVKGFQVKVKKAVNN